MEEEILVGDKWRERDDALWRECARPGALPALATSSMAGAWSHQSNLVAHVEIMTVPRRALCADASRHCEPSTSHRAR